MTDETGSDQLKFAPGLVTNLVRGDCVLFFGDDTGPLPTGDCPPGRSAFAARLAAKLKTDDLDPRASHWEIAEAYQAHHGRHSLISELGDWIEEAGAAPYPIHRAIALLPLEAIITTCTDDRLERALIAAGKTPVKVVTDVDVPFVGADKVLVLKLFGDLDNKESLVLTDSDQIALHQRLRPLLSVVRYLFVIKTLLFVGLDLRDEAFKSLYGEVVQGTKDYKRRGYALRSGAKDLERSRWSAQGLELVDAQPVPFLKQLAQALPAEPQPPAGKPGALLQLLNRRPYVFLKYYELEDREVFFGRETESLLLWRKILSYRLVVLFGASGAGKSSLLNAGVWPRLTPYGFLVCSVRVGGNPAAEVRKAAWAALHPGAAGDPGPEREGLASFFARAMAEEQRLVVFIDQFEELFVNLAPKVQASFLRDLAQCVRELPRQVRFVLALREDFLPQLEAQRDLLLQYDANSFRLEALGRAAAELAITEPAHRVGLAYEPALVRTLVDDLAEGGRIPPPQLQIVCDRLYDRAVGAVQGEKAQALAEQTGAIFSLGRPAQEARAAITCQQYQALGGARTLLADYVGERIAALPEAQREPARAILKTMITGEETKAVLAEVAIAQRARLAAAMVEETLANLVQDRLVRRLQGEPDTLYELAHEHMIARIRSWVGQQERDAEFARKLLDEQLGRWRKLGQEGLIDLDTLKRIHAQRENPYFTLTAAEELELLLRSALAYGFEVPTWFERACAAGIPADVIALEGLRSENFRTRAAAVRALAGLGERFADSLLPMLADVYPQVRVAAIAGLERLRPDGAWRQGLVYECYVPAGEFIMGDDTGLDNEKLVHPVYLDAFYIGKYPVTNAEYARFRADGGRGFDMPAGKENHPVVNVSWYDAKEYADWAGMRLLTEAEWEKAASWEPVDKGTSRQGIVQRIPGTQAAGGRKRKYPWGDTFDRRKCNTQESGIGDTTPVGKYSPAGDSPCGAADMAGNVLEWCSSLDKGYPYRADDGRESLTEYAPRVGRGGSFGNTEPYARCGSRDSRGPNGQDGNYGFRVGWASPSDSGR